MTKSPRWTPNVPNPESLSMSFDLHDHGWASLSILLGKQEYKIDQFSYLTDGLGDLVRAALMVVTGSSHAQVIFDGEPEIWGLAIEPAGLSKNNERVMRTTIRDDTNSIDMSQPVRNWPSQLLLDGYVTSDSFGKAVEEVTLKARADFDDATYRSKWGYHGSLEGFPLRGLSALREALKIDEYRE